MKKVIHTVALFSSFSTLFCCALPALLTTIGAGAVMIGLVSAVPQLVWLSAHKIGLFIFAGTMLTISGISRYATRNAACPIDPQEAKACKRLRRTSRIVYIVSLTIYAIGFFFAFIARYLI